MQKYEGRKQILAKPMTLLEYNKYRNWEMPEDEDGTTEGYLVEYLDGGKANHPEHTNYISWSPKDVFDKSYKLIDTYDQRIQLEYKELMEKITKLRVFIESDIYSEIAEDDQQLLQEQYKHMKGYLRVLYTRLWGISD